MQKTVIKMLENNTAKYRLLGNKTKQQKQVCVEKREIWPQFYQKTTTR